MSARPLFANDIRPPRRLKPPGPHLLALEFRAPWEAAASIALWPLLMRAPRGDGHPVMVLPGLGAPDASTLLLRRFLAGRGYKPHAWGQGVNLGPRRGVLEACVQRIRDIRRKSGRKPSLVGWSLGGIYARELAKQLPDDVRLVISLGSPFTGSPRATNAWPFFELVSGQRSDDPAMHAQIRCAPPVPFTSIYSRTDGIVSWRCSIEADGPQAENIGVRASHVGMGAHPAVLLAIADRLAQPEGQWQPFRHDGARRWLFEDPRRAA